MGLFARTGLRKQEATTGSELRRAIEESRKLSLHESRFYLQELNSHPRLMSAVNPDARERWGEMVCEEISRHFQLGPERQEPRQPIYFVTLCDRRCCTSHQTSEIPIKRFIQKLRRGLRGLSYFGMIEPAFYANVCPGTYVGDRKRMVCWHLHLLAWGKSKTWVKKRIKRLNENILLPIADGLSPAHQKGISKGKFPDKIRYMLKAPGKAYRLFRVEAITPDGEIVFNFRQKKQPLRPGERIALFRLMQDMYLDQLALAAGEGTHILRPLKRQVQRRLPN